MANYLINYKKFRSQPIKKKGQIYFFGLEKDKPGNPAFGAYSRLQKTQQISTPDAMLPILISTPDASFRGTMFYCSYTEYAPRITASV